MLSGGAVHVHVSHWRMWDLVLDFSHFLYLGECAFGCRRGFGFLCFHSGAKFGLTSESRLSTSHQTTGSRIHVVFQGGGVDPFQGLFRTAGKQTNQHGSGWIIHTGRRQDAHPSQYGHIPYAWTFFINTAATIKRLRCICVPYVLRYIQRLACTSGFILWKGESVRSYDVKHSTSMKAVGILFGSSLDRAVLVVGHKREGLTSNLAVMQSGFEFFLATWKH